MKIQFRDIEPFIKKPDPKIRAILIYGPDNGLMRERAQTLGKTIVDDLNDPFNAVTLSAGALLEDPARLMDEAHALSMMGGDRLIRIEDSSDKIAPALKNYLQNPSLQNLLVLEAGELSPRSALRKLFEKEKNTAAVPCYVEGERDLTVLIRQELNQTGHKIEPDALNWLASNLTGDRGQARSGIEKLITYMGGPSSEKSAQQAIMLHDVQTCCGEAGVQSLEDLVYSVIGGNTETALKTYSHLINEGVSVIAVLRTLQNHLRRLHITKARIESGQDLNQAIKSLRPPVFFKQESAFKMQLQRWPLGRIESTLQRLTVLEAQCKKTGMPVETLCSQTLLGISKNIAKAA